MSMSVPAPTRMKLHRAELLDGTVWLFLAKNWTQARQHPVVLRSVRWFESVGVCYSCESATSKCIAQDISLPDGDIHTGDTPCDPKDPTI